MNRIVLDASALLAVLNAESGGEALSASLLRNAVISTVNLSEVQGKLVQLGIAPEDAWEAATSAVGEIAPFSAEHAKIAGTLIAHTRSLGLSLGDRACLALALALKAPAYTADKSWKNLRLPVRIHTIR